jgi:trehalose 6-phosphate phosphatase
MLQPATRDISGSNKAKLAHFFAQLSRAPARALLLDYDGTLAPFHQQRENALPYPRVAELLKKLSSTGTRLVIATGRPAKEAALFLRGQSIEIWGSHGLERLRPNGSYELAKLDPGVVKRLSEVNELLLKEGLGCLLERKPSGTAIHWRGLESTDRLRERVEQVWSSLPTREGLRLMPFDGGMEILTSARTKRDVVRTLLSEMRKGACVAYLGDDQTDEDAFAALQGFGLSVLVQEKYRPTVADVWIRPPEGLIAFLSDWVRACERPSVTT